jgi:pimeloyl-ACP methyl ester carboxylesterase
VELEILRLKDGRSLSYATVGPSDGKPVLFCHSLPGSHVQPAFVHELMPKYGLRLIAADRPGFGRSDFQPGRTVADWPADMAQLADSLGLERFSMLGVSAGSPYVLACCASMPERIERAAIAIGITPEDHSSIIHTAVPAPIGWAVRRSRRLSHLIHTGLVTGMKRKPERAMAALSKSPSEADTLLFSRGDVGEFIIAVSLAAAERGVQGWVYDDWLLSRPWGISLEAIPAELPVDFWIGGDDPAVPLAHAERLAHSVPGAELHVFPGEGHFSVIFNRADDIFGALAA